MTTKRITRTEAAALARVSVRTISRWVAAGRLTALYQLVPGPDGRTVLSATFDPREVARARGQRPRTGPENA